MSCSSSDSASLSPPSAAAAISSLSPSSTVTPSRAARPCSRAAMASTPIGRNSMRWQRLRNVSGSLCSSVVQKMNFTPSGGSSSVLRNALNAGMDSMWTSSTIQIRYRDRTVA